jgi:hypothetical protein
MFIRYRALVFALSSIFVGVGLGFAASPKRNGPTAVPADSAGNIHVPTNYRMTYDYLGTWSVAAKSPGPAQLHFVFVSPGGVAGYRRYGKFPDGTVLVKEVYEAETAAMTTGPAVSHASKLKGWFVLIKDSRGRHPKNPLWGNGWGWSWFDADNTTKTTSTNFHTDCLGCHTPAQGTDWIYVQGYPSLHK